MEHFDETHIFDPRYVQIKINLNSLDDSLKMSSQEVEFDYCTADSGELSNLNEDKIDFLL